MKNEAEFKSLFKKSVKSAKGFSLSLAAPMIPGIPDLYVVLPGYMPVLLEAKWLGKIERNNFSRKMKYTALQIEWIKSCHEVVKYSAMGLAGFEYKEAIYAVLLDYEHRLFYQVTNEFQSIQTNCAYTSKELRNTGQPYFDVLDLFSKVPIPRVGFQTRIIHDAAGSRIALAV